MTTSPGEAAVTAPTPDAGSAEPAAAAADDTGAAMRRRAGLVGTGLIGSSIACSIIWITRDRRGWRTPIRVGIESRCTSWSVRIEE